MGIWGRKANAPGVAIELRSCNVSAIVELTLTMSQSELQWKCVELKDLQILIRIPIWSSNCWLYVSIYYCYRMDECQERLLKFRVKFHVFHSFQWLIKYIRKKKSIILLKLCSKPTIWIIHIEFVKYYKLIQRNKQENGINLCKLNKSTHRKDYIIRETILSNQQHPLETMYE